VKRLRYGIDMDGCMMEIVVKAFDVLTLRYTLVVLFELLVVVRMINYFLL
jgi:hypothetical protein